mmetsp:Transcript_19800/g.30898  ORF Transcript_19800/g.30898 Transcript_19800/m.30898 type:complete len:243 (-) Transcript_19800:816-1544(-)
MKPIPPPEAPPCMQKPQKFSPNLDATLSINVSVYLFVADGMTERIGPKKFSVVHLPISFTSLRRNASIISSRISIDRCLACHSASSRSRYFSVTISRTGPTFILWPPCTNTKLFSNAFNNEGGASSSLSNLCLGNSRPRLTPYSGSPIFDLTPWMSFSPGQTPPESCHPPPLPPNHSPNIALAATNLLSSSRRGPSIHADCLVALIATEMIDPSKFVDTANLDPFGIFLTKVVSSKPTLRCC